MPRTENLARSIRKYLSSRTNTTIKSKRSTTAVVIASVALVAAVAFTVSVESRSGGWLRKALSIAPQSEVKSDATATSNSPNSVASSPNSVANSPNSVALSPATPLAPTVTATKTDALLTDADVDGKADPGDTLKYTVGITAAGETATGVTFSDTVDPNTALVNGTIFTTPIARPDTYSAAGNIRITVAAPGVLANDSDADDAVQAVDPPLTVTAGTLLSAQGGNVTLNADGSFTYNPAPGFEGSDSFTYTLNDGEGPGDTSTVSITVTGMIWFINNNASSCVTPAAGCGRLTNPFSTLAAFEAVNGVAGVNNPAANDNIFVYESATPYVGPLTLENGQKFIGQDAAATLSSISGVVPPAGSDPLPATSPGAPIVNITGNGITVAQNNILRGFTGGDATTDITGTGFGTLNVSDVTLNGNGQALNLSTGTLNGTFASISSTSSATTGISLTSVAGSLSSGSTTISNPTGIGISVGTSSATLSLANTSVTGSGNTGISLTTNTGAITFGSLTITPDAGQRGLLATNNTQTITATSGSVSTTNNVAVEITRAGGSTPLAITLTSVGASGGTSGIVMTNTGGSFTITGNGADVTLGGNGTGGTITGMTGSGINLSGVTNISLTSMLIQNNGDDGITGLNVSGFTFNRNRSINNGNAVLERGLEMTNLLGTASITNSLVTGNAEDNLFVQNGSGTLNLTTTGTTYANTSATIGNDGIHFLMAAVAGSNNANMSITVTNCIFTNHRGDHFQALTDAATTGTQTVVFQNNDLNNTVGTNLGAGLTLNPSGNATVNFNISNNGTLVDPFTGAFSSAITVNSSGNANMSGTINNNVIGNPAVTDSGSFSADAITVFANQKSDITVAITNNRLREYSNTSGINMQARDDGGAAGAGGSINATITGNIISDPGTFAGNGIFSSAGSVAGDDHFMCVDIGGAGALANTIVGSGANGSEDFFVRQRFLTTVRLPGYVGANNNDAAVVAFIQGRNTGAETGLATNQVATGGGGFVGGAACTSPALGPITEASASETALKTEDPVLSDGTERILWATRGENKDPQHVLSLTPAEVSAMAQAAIARWAEAGLSAKKLAQLQGLSFEIADLPTGQLATVTSSKITLDETAAGYGWFFDATPSDDNEFEVTVENKELQTTELSAANGRVDLLTVLMRQLGSTVQGAKAQAQTPMDVLMENTLEPGTRRAPAFRKTDVAKASTPKAGSGVAAVGKSNVAAPKYQQVAVNGQRNSRSTSRRHHAMVTPRAAAPMSFVDVMLNIGDLPAGKTVTIMFNVTVDNPYLGATNQVSNQGTVSGTNFANVLTDDPDVAGLANPTLTMIDQPDVSVAVSPASVLEDGTDNLVYTFTREGSTAAALTVNFSVGGTATFSTDYTQTGAATFNATSGTVTIPIGSSTATVTLDPTTDTTVEANETAILTVIAGQSYDIGTPASASGTITNDDTDVTVAVAPSSVEEDGVPNLVYTFTRNGVTTGPLTVNFTVGGTATFNTDYTQTGAATFTATDGTVTFGAGNTTAAVTVDPTTDNTVESNETVILTLATGAGYNVAIPDTATGTITNDDAEVTLAVAPSSVDEDGVPNLVYTFTRTGDTTGALVVNFTIAGTADPATDYTQIGATTFTPPNGTVTFGAGNSTATVTVDPTADAAAEANETVIFTLAAGADYNIGTPSTATGTILNDDTTVSVAVAPLATDEDGATNLVYTFTRSDSSGELTVNFSVGGTATFSTDYTQTGAATFTPPTGTVTFADGSLTATVTVDPAADLTVEPDETVILTVAAGSGYTVGVPASATGTITNDDTDVSVAVAPLSTTEDGAGNLVYTFTRTGVTTGALTVNFSIGGSATFSTDYTQTGATTFAPPAGTVDFLAGSSTATVTVDPTADNSVEPDETVILTVATGTGYNVGAPSVATGTITNDDSTVSVAVAPSSVDEDGATNLVYTFTRTGDTTSALTVNFSVGGTADSSTDYTQIGAATFTPPTGTVTFGAGNSTATVTVDPSADAATEADETVILTVTAGTGYEVGAPDSATGTINNDDNAVSVAVSPGAVNEDGATNLVYTFTRGDSSGELTVNFSVGGTATFSTDYNQTGAATFTPPTGTVTFADGSLTATVTVDPSADLTVEADETVILTVTAGAGYTVGVPASATGTITNDDTDVSVAVSPLSTTEDGAGNLVYTFTRTGVTTSALTVNFSINGTATFSTDYMQSGAASFTPPTGTVTFSAGSSTATVTVDPTADGAAEGDETVILTVTAGTGYNVGAPSTATGTITNDDTEVSVAVAPSSVLEDGPTNMVFTFTRTGIISGPLTVNFSVGGTAAYAPPGGDYQTDNPLTFSTTSGTVTFLAGSSTATVIADPFGDADLEANETVILTITAGAGYTVGSPNSATGTILNDDNQPPTIVVGYGQCGGGSTGTMNLLVNDVETPAGSLILSATSSNTAVVPLGNITFGGSGANRTVTISAITKNSVAFSDVTITVFDGTFTSSINIRVIVGTNKTETINIGTTTVGTDMIFGGNGDDTINSGAGNDLICGGNGGGAVNAGLGDDTVDGGNGNDTLRGGDGNDLIFGGGGNDTLEGGNHNDTIDGGTGTDILRGESGDDTLTGGSGPDSFNGGPGSDTATDFNAGQGDTKDISVEIASLFGATNDWGGVFAYLASPRWWVSPFPSDVYSSSRYFVSGPFIGNKQ